MSSLSTNSLVCGQNCLDCTKFTNPSGELYYKCNSEDGKDGSVIIIILSIVGILLLIVMVIFIIIKLRRRKFLSTTTQHKKIEEIEEGQINNNIEYFVSTKNPKTPLEENGESIKHPNAGNANNIIIHKILTDATRKKDSILKNIPVSTNCRNLQPQQIIQNMIREKNESKSKPISEMALHDQLAWEDNRSLGDDSPIQRPKKKSLLKFNYKQLKQKEMNQFGREYDLSSVDCIQINKPNDI
jgi:hypothetical protein